MSDAFSDLEKQKRDEVERWRKLAKEQFVSELSKEELVEELCKREGVEYTEVVAPEKYWITQTDDGEAYDPLHGVGNVTILVVRE